MKISDTNVKKNRSSTKTFIAIIIIAFLILIVIISPIFQVRSINFEGGEHYSKEEILSKLGINIGDNVFMVKAKHSENQLKKDPFINSVNIDVHYPNTLNIVIKERKVRGYVPYMGAYLYIDEQGRVLEVANSYKQKLPIVEGLDFDEFRKGDILKVKNMDSFDAVLKTANMMLKYEFIDDVVKIDASDPKNVHLYIRHIDVLLGDLNDYDEKIRTMLEVVKKIPEQDRGFLNIKDLTKPIIFEYLT
jgi:hypothetical protein